MKPCAIVTASAVHQNGFNRFGDAVAADALGPVPRHDADDQRAADGHEDDQRPEMMTGGRHERRVESLKEKKVRAESDQFQQRGGDVGGDDADPHSEEGDRDDAWRGGEIAQVIELGRGRRWHGISVSATFTPLCRVEPVAVLRHDRRAKKGWN